MGLGVELSGHIDNAHAIWDLENGWRTEREEVGSTSFSYYYAELTEEENIFTPSLAGGKDDMYHIESSKTETVVEVLGLDSLNTGASIYTPFGGAQVSLDMSLQEYWEEWFDIWIE